MRISFLPYGIGGMKWLSESQGVYGPKECWEPPCHVLPTLGPGDVGKGKVKKEIKGYTDTC